MVRKKIRKIRKSPPEGAVQYRFFNPKGNLLPKKKPGRPPRYSDYWVYDHFRKGYQSNTLHRHYGISPKRLKNLKRKWIRGLQKQGFTLSRITGWWDMSNKETRDLLRAKNKDFIN